jgi:hypothetical protein
MLTPFEKSEAMDASLEQLKSVCSRGHRGTVGCMIPNQRFLVVKVQPPLSNADAKV